MGFAVLHLEKAKGTDSSMSAHIERKFQPLNVDTTRSFLNKELIDFPVGVLNRTQAISYRLNNAGIKRKIGSNQVRAIRVLLTGSHDDMQRILETNMLDKWCNDNLEWLYSTFGKQNVVSAVVHMDEFTPHIHATVVPIVVGKRRKEKSDNSGINKKRKNSMDTVRLCADDLMTRSKLKTYQDSYALMMSNYGLKRGVDGSAAKHISTAEYYKFLVNQSEDLKSNISELQTKTDEMQEKLTKVKSDIHTQELKNAATDATIAITNSVASIFGRGKIRQMEIDNDSLKNEIEADKIKIEELKNNINEIHGEYRLKIQKEREEQKKLEAIISKAYRWFPQFSDLLQLENTGLKLGLSSQQFTEMVRGNIVSFTGKLFSQHHKRWFDVKMQNISIETNNEKIGIYIANLPISQWFNNFIEKFNLKKMIDEQRRKRSIKL